MKKDRPLARSCRIHHVDDQEYQGLDETKSVSDSSQLV